LQPARLRGFDIVDVETSSVEQENIHFDPNKSFTIKSMYGKRFIYARSSGDYETGFGACKIADSCADKWRFEKTTYEGRNAFYIYNEENGRVMYAKAYNGVNYEQGVGASWDGSKGYIDDQKWFIEHHNTHEGLTSFYIKNAKHGRNLYAEIFEEEKNGGMKWFGAYSENTKLSDDMVWYFENGQAKISIS